MVVQMCTAAQGILLKTGCQAKAQYLSVLEICNVAKDVSQDGVIWAITAGTLRFAICLVGLCTGFSYCSPLQSEHVFIWLSTPMERLASCTLQQNMVL